MQSYRPISGVLKINVAEHLLAQYGASQKHPYLGSRHRMLMRAQQLTNTIHVSLLGRYQQSSASVESLHTPRLHQRKQL